MVIFVLENRIEQIFWKCVFWFRLLSSISNEREYFNFRKLENCPAHCSKTKSFCQRSFFYKSIITIETMQLYSILIFSGFFRQNNKLLHWKKKNNNLTEQNWIRKNWIDFQTDDANFSMFQSTTKTAPNRI